MHNKAKLSVASAALGFFFGTAIQLRNWHNSYAAGIFFAGALISLDDWMGLRGSREWERRYVPRPIALKKAFRAVDLRAIIKQLRQEHPEFQESELFLSPT